MTRGIGSWDMKSHVHFAAVRLLDINSKQPASLLVGLQAPYRASQDIIADGSLATQIHPMRDNILEDGVKSERTLQNQVVGQSTMRQSVMRVCTASEDGRFTEARCVLTCFWNRVWEETLERFMLR